MCHRDAPAYHKNDLVLLVPLVFLLLSAGDKSGGNKFERGIKRKSPGTLIAIVRKENAEAMGN